ncbi:MAG TPA: class I SAM-dependent DNA methyltransferase [Candidatus Competibacteraceae bacterium]|nr:class I SAM-dependent DNA methyltransferase [Candidatus Competibacteraceae bacterium]HSA47249.1 class I SAM-dependent DNA methyltransferase [Candidatus Competibacteraceae bacterium]
MPLSWNEIKDRALQFSQHWVDETSEHAEAKTFWDEFFQVFGVSRRRVATFETKVKKIDGRDGYVDLLWRGILLIEHKSRGKDLDRAFAQAKDYFPGIQDRDLPRYLLVSDFARFRLYDLEQGESHEFPLAALYQNVRLFGFIAGYQTTTAQEQDPVNIQAAERMGRLHDQLKAIGYGGHELEVYLVRLLFCLFAEDTSIFERRQFQDLIEQRTAEDGQDLAHWLADLFQALDTPVEKRLKMLDEQLAAFPYVNGRLFAERLSIAAFNAGMRQLLLEACALDWSRISPAIFGSLFQSVMDATLRRHLGAHYTTEKNILKLIGPLFLDEWRAEFARVKQQPKRLAEFHQRLAQLKFLDPACGCGNFLVIAYRELRELELDVLRVLYKNQRTASLDVAQFNILCDVDQFYGIEIAEFPAQIAQTALWLMDHQMNLRVSEEFGRYFVRLPLRKSATIVHGNALRMDWREIVKPAELSYILGNPPFVGKKEQSAAQKQDMTRIFTDTSSAGVLDYVAAWYRKAADYMADHPAIKAAFVSTNSITQGEQVGVLWADLLKRGVKIHFAHRTFQWSSEARGKAAVHCVIIGFALRDTPDKRLFDYETPHSEPQEIKTTAVNPYLIDAPDVLLTKRMSPLGDAPKMDFGSKAADFGHLTLSEEDRTDLLQQHPSAASWVRPFIGSEEFINGSRRYCLWLKGISASELRSYPWIMRRIEEVRSARIKSNKKQTNEWAKFPTLFIEDRQPTTDYLLIPKVSSERREYVPLGFCQAHLIVNPSVLVVPDATLFHFGVLQSAMHMAWMRYTAGRMKSDYQYSNTIVYNNFPWPQTLADPQKQAIEDAAQAVLDARTRFPDSSLADLYDPLTMPPALTQAHQKLDAAVDTAYAKRKFNGDSERVTFLFALYQQLISPLAALATKPTRQRKSHSDPVKKTKSFRSPTV